MPLLSANYSGGIIITDWYSDNSAENESIKITIRFLTSEVRSDAIKVTPLGKIVTQKIIVQSIKKMVILHFKLKVFLKKAALYKEEKLKKIENLIVRW